MTAPEERLLKIAELMDAGDDGAIPSFIAMTKILHGRQTTWRQIIEKMIDANATPPASNFQRSPSAPSQKTNVVDINEWLNALPSEPACQRSPSKILSGTDVPSRASGIVSIIEERVTRNGSPMLLVSIENSNATLEPIAVFAHDLVTAIKNGDALSGIASIDAPARAHLYPILTNFEDVRTPRAA